MRRAFQEGAEGRQGGQKSGRLGELKGVREDLLKTYPGDI